MYGSWFKIYPRNRSLSTGYFSLSIRTVVTGLEREPCTEKDDRVAPAGSLTLGIDDEIDKQG